MSSTPNSCCVAGAAKGVKLPHNYDTQTLIAANWIASQLPRTPHIWCTNNLFLSGGVWTARDGSNFLSTARESMRGANFREIWVDTRDGSTAESKSSLHTLSITSDQLIEVPPVRRDYIVQSACGLALGDGDVPYRVSTGLFALCLAVFKGYDHITVCGISISDGQYREAFDLPIDSPPRGHMPADREAFEGVLTLNPDKILTTSEELHRDYNVPLVDGVPV